MPNFKSMYEDSENLKTDRVNTAVFNLHRIKLRNILGRHSIWNQEKDAEMLAFTNYSISFDSQYISWSNLGRLQSITWRTVWIVWK